MQKIPLNWNHMTSMMMYKIKLQWRETILTKPGVGDAVEQPVGVALVTSG